MISRIQSAWRALTTPATRTAALWDAAGAGNRWANAPAVAASPNMHWDNPAISRARAEHQYRNDALCRKVVESVCNSTVGANGIQPLFKEREFQAAWSDWATHCDAEGRLNWEAFQWQVLRAVVISGECFVLLSMDPAADGIPLRVQILGPEFLDTSRSDESTYAGIRYSGAKPEGYWLYERNPGINRFNSKSRYVSAVDCFHVFRPTAPGAQRGQSWLSPVLLPLKEVQEYMEAALVKAKVAALYAGFIRTVDGANPIATNGVPTLEPGSMTRLLPTEEVTFSEPPDVGTSFDPFIRSQLRRIAAGIGIPYEILSGDNSQITFASGRHGLLEYKRTIEAVQYLLLVPRLCEPILERWASLAVALGLASSMPVKTRWIAPVLAMLDEGAEVRATVAEIRNGLTSRSEAVTKRGWRSEEIDAEIAADNERADRLGLTLDCDPRKITQQGQEQQSQTTTEAK
ncbi:MAG: phage portal protein [Acidobacteria bacterium]|nr:phage portal protein [Acidobacteriota bacterium]